MPLTTDKQVTTKYISRADVKHWEAVYQKRGWQFFRSSGSILFKACRGNETIYFCDNDKPHVDGRKGKIPAYNPNHPFRRGIKDRP